MTSSMWERVRKRIDGKSPRYEGGLQRVAFRLAAQTVILLLVMLVALEVVVYAITQHTLFDSLESTVKTRAMQPHPEVCEALHLSCGPRGTVGPRGGPPGLQRGPGKGTFTPTRNPEAPPFVASTNPSEASAAFVNSTLRVVHGDGSLGTVLLDSSSARYALRTNKDQCCSVKDYKGQDYLVYTRPLTANGKIVGAVQTSISEHQYEGTMRTLLEALLVVAVLGLIGSGGISAVLTRRALQPIRFAMQRQRDFVADAAHELRTPLTIMRTVGEVGMSEPATDELQATIAQMLGENQHLTRLVEDLSLLARADTDAVAIDQSPVDLSSLVSETAAELEPLAEAEGVTLTTDVAKNIWTLGDILRLRQLLLILFDNALKHTPAGGIVSVRLTAQDDRARLEVTDSGPGISPADLPRIFDRFYRADQARSGEGSGLGLAIGKWIVEAHGGQIQAGNATPRGAVFSLILPISRTRIPS
jgi:signal transduction histidine kinase